MVCIERQAFPRVRELRGHLRDRNATPDLHARVVEAQVVRVLV
jgi:hypothetical protein